MNSVRLLLKVQLRNLFGFNTAMHGGSGKKKALFFLSMFVLVPYLVAILFFYCWTMAGAMPGGAADVLPLMLLMTVFLTLLTAIYRSGGTLFYTRDYDLVMSLPLRTSAVAISRMAMLYIMELGFTLMVLLPAGAVYAIQAAPAWPFYPIYILCMLTAPLIPLVLGALIGSLVAALASRFKRLSNVMTTVFSLVFVLVVMYFSMSLSSDPARLASGGAALTGRLGAAYPLLGLFSRAVVDLDIVALLLFLLISLGLFFLFGLLLSTRYKAICTRLMSTGATGRAYRMDRLKTSSPMKALYKRDLKRYFSSSVYVMNSAFGFLLSIIACAALLAVGTEKLSSLAGPALPALLASAAPAAVALLVGMAPTTYCAISIEGRNLWITKSLPVTTSQIFRSKLYVNMTLALPTAVLDGALLCIALRPGAAACVLMFLLPLLTALFTALLGLSVNLLLPKLDWTSEMAVVKQSAACMVVVLLGMGLGILMLLLSILLPNALPALYILCAFLALGAGLLWLWLRRAGAKRFAQL